MRNILLNDIPKNLKFPFLLQIGTPNTG